VSLQLEVRRTNCNECRKFKITGIGWLAVSVFVCVCPRVYLRNQTTVVHQQSAVTWPTAVQYRDQTDLDSTRISVSVAISDSVIRSHGLDVFISCIIDNARNNARCTKARKATHGLDGQHQDVDRTPRGRVNQNDR